MSENIYMDVIHDSICGDIKKTYESKAYAGAVILTLSAIDAMASLSMPTNQKDVKGPDYITWVNTYMKTDPAQSYQYAGVDIYGARCGFLHRYGMSSKLSETGQCKIFAYHNGSEHIYNPQVNKNMVMISHRRIINDFYRAVESFLGSIEENENLRKLVDSRITSLFRISNKESLKNKYKNKNQIS